MAESSKAGSSRSRGAGRDTDKLLEKMLYGSGTDMMDLDDLEQVFKDNEDDTMDNDEDEYEEEDEEELEDEDQDWDENVDDEITQESFYFKQKQNCSIFIKNSDDNDDNNKTRFKEKEYNDPIKKHNRLIRLIYFFNCPI